MCSTILFKMKHEPIALIRSLLAKLGKSEKSLLTPLPQSGSDRLYYKITFENGEHPDLITFYNPVVEENRAQIEFTQHFRALGMHVPDILAFDESETVFILEYLGDKSLFDFLSETSESQKIIDRYKKAISDLVRFQVSGGRNIDYSKAYPVANFDKQTILWDLNYFKYCFLKPARIPFHEDRLERDFQTFTDALTTSSPNFFCYRDFQSRNIMIHDDELWYIDFQGGRKGPLPYDLVSLLHQVKAKLPETTKEILFNYYLDELAQVAPEEVAQVKHHYNYFVYFRIMQVLGAYGFRGLMERKAHFLQSLPTAGNALNLLIKNHPLDLYIPELKKVFTEITERFYETNAPDRKSLTVHVSSFSYKKKGPPQDFTGNGGGFVFDCRALPNPHRYATLRDLTGEDEAIRSFMLKQPETEAFLEHVFALVDTSVENYLKRGFLNLQVDFGCTGGRHRSVFSSIQLTEHLENKHSGIFVSLTHIEINSRSND